SGAVCCAVVDRDFDHGLADVLAVGAHVLDGGGADPAGDTGEGFHSGQSLVYTAGDEGVPFHPGVNAHADDGVVDFGVGEVGGVHLDHRAREPFVGHHQVAAAAQHRSEEHTSELQSRENLVCRLLLE